MRCSASKNFSVLPEPSPADTVYNMKRFGFLFLLTVSILLPCSAQQSFAPLPVGFRAISMGMSMEKVKEELGKDGLYAYEGDPEVSMQNEPPNNSIETAGSTFVEKAVFQFNEDKLYIMILFLNREKLDYYTMYTTLKAKYGPPKTLDPESMMWDNEKIRMSLERPLQIKYIDNAVFGALIEQGMAEQSIEAYTREKFLKDF